MRRGPLLLAAGLALAAAVGIAAIAVAAFGGGGDEQLPDLDMAAPGEISGRTIVVAGKPRFYFGFESAAGNIGDGPLVVRGSRPSTREPEMRLVQVVRSDDGSSSSARVAATLRYVHSADHAHWHYLDFMRYELRRADGTLVAPDRKTGFCLGDRYPLAAEAAQPQGPPEFEEECGKGQKQLLTLEEGISVGFGDDYEAHLEGQNFDVTGLPAGRYLLVHRVNSERVLRESDYDNNDSSMAFELAWPRGSQQSPSVTVLQRCPDTDTCP